MKLLLPSDISKSMRRHMLKAHKREIGGMLMGEETGKGEFRLVDFSVDTESGSKGHFMRDANLHEKHLQEFFARTGSNYGRYNYLGEWHTHPSFSVQPSLTDIQSMQGLVEGPHGVGFAVLLISKLKWFRGFECGAWLFIEGHHPTSVEILREHSIEMRQEAQKDQ